MNITSVRTTSKTSIIAHAGIFSGAYLLYGFISGVTVGQQLHGLDAHIARGFLMAILAARLGKNGGPTLMGLISGVLLTGIPGPSAIFLFPASLAAGILYDSLMKLGDYGRNTLSTIRIVVIAALSGAAEAAVVTAGFTAIGFFGAVSSILLLSTWLFLIGRNLILSAVGGGLAVVTIRARRNLAPRNYTS